MVKEVRIKKHEKNVSINLNDAHQYTSPTLQLSDLKESKSQAYERFFKNNPSRNYKGSNTQLMQSITEDNSFQPSSNGRSFEQSPNQETVPSSLQFQDQSKMPLHHPFIGSYVYQTTLKKCTMNPIKQKKITPSRRSFGVSSDQMRLIQKEQKRYKSITSRINSFRPVEEEVRLMLRSPAEGPKADPSNNNDFKKIAAQIDQMNDHKPVFKKSIYEIKNKVDQELAVRVTNDTGASNLDNVKTKVYNSKNIQHFNEFEKKYSKVPDKKRKRPMEEYLDPEKIDQLNKELIKKVMLKNFTSKIFASIPNYQPGQEKYDPLI